MATKRIRNVVPDRIDLRDRRYMPAIHLPPPRVLKPVRGLLVLDQGSTNACTGFALAAVANFLLRRHWDRSEPSVSPYMLYSMARRYDEFPGSTSDTGSSVRGAMKGWYKHGACDDRLWTTGLRLPPANKKAKNDWWLDAAKRPLGAYYRVDTRSITDMHVALSEVGILYASAVCHSGWIGRLAPAGSRSGFPTIRHQPAAPSDGGHAFAIVGYDDQGFLLQNSWGPAFGLNGIARLLYADWIENAMDCWVAQLGVATSEHLEIAGSTTLRMRGKRVELAKDEQLRNREISPFVIDLENNGRLSNSGTFRTSAGDIAALVDIHLVEARRRWKLRDSESIDVAVYAHGGLTGENAAAETAANWIPALYGAQIFPIFLMWETGLWSTIRNRLTDLIAALPKPTAGVVDRIERFWNARVEGLVSAPGTALWTEMKQNAKAISGDQNSGAWVLYKSLCESPHFANGTVRLHLIGHSAGSIVHCHAAHRLWKEKGWKFETANFLAPAVRFDTFQETLVPMLGVGSLKRVNCFNLSTRAEQTDPTCWPVLGYGRSLLYLVSHSFEGKQGKPGVPLLGMQEHFDREAASLELPRLKQFLSPGDYAWSTTHGGFEDDELARNTVISLIKTGRPNGDRSRRSGARRRRLT